MIFLHTGHEHLPKAESFVDFLSYWDLAPYIVIPIVLASTLYLVGRWRLGQRTKYTPPGMLRDLLYLAGILALALALLSPIDVYAGDLFFMHMVQHLLLMMAAPPLLQLANPMSRILWAFPRGIRRRIGGTLNSAGVLRLALQGVTVPVIAWLIFVVTIWVWHTPALYNAALASEGMHVLEHLTMFAAAIVFWWPVIGPAPVRSKMPHPLRFLYLFLALFQNIILGAILTFAQGPVYAYYEGTPGHWGFNGAMDQQLGGVLMWIPGTMMYFTALALLFFAWLEQEERRTAQLQEIEEARRNYLAKMGRRSA